MDVARVVFYCDDRKVGAVLRTLTGVAIGTPEVTPVTNAKVGRNGLQQATTGEALEMLKGYIKKRKLTEVNAAVGKEFQKSIGRREGGYNYLFDAARKEGVLRKVGKGMHTKWRVVK